MKKIKIIASILLITISLIGFKQFSNEAQVEITQDISLAATAYFVSQDADGFAAVAGGMGAVYSGGIYYGAILAGAGPVGWAVLGGVAL